MLDHILAFLVDAGVDEPIADHPNDRFAEEASRLAARSRRNEAPSASPLPSALGGVNARAPASPTDAGGRRASPTPVQDQARPDAVAAATAAAAACASLEDLRAAVAAFQHCPLKHTATNTVFADGNPQSGIVLIGEAPGAEEDRIGLPFVGASGQLLDRMLATIDLDRTKVYITNVVFWRPPQNRKPTEAELAICRPFVERHLALLNPRLLVIVGGTASGALMPGSEGITRLRGRPLVIHGAGVNHPIQAIAMYHPSFLLRSPERKRETWSDLLYIKSKIEATSK